MLLPLPDLQQELSELEAGSFTHLSDDQLLHKIRFLHGGFTFQTPLYPADTLIYRAVRATGPPPFASLISHPPAEYVKVNGRLNNAGEVIFYGALEQFPSCLLESGAQLGETFAVSAWRTKASMKINHLGYSKAVFDQRNVGREPPLFSEMERDIKRNQVIREWQSRVFTASVAPGHEHLYRLPIALKALAIGRDGQTDPVEPIPFSGVQYPSVAGSLLNDNVAILPPEVDKKMQLLEVAFLRVDSINTTSAGENKGENHPFLLKFIDFATPSPDGTLSWGQTSMTIQPPLRIKPV